MIYTSVCQLLGLSQTACSAAHTVYSAAASTHSAATLEVLPNHAYAYTNYINVVKTIVYSGSEEEILLLTYEYGKWQQR